MNRSDRIFNFIACLALLPAGPAFTLPPSAEAAPEATAPAPVAHVYVQMSGKLYIYDAAANGALTPVKGSPLSTTGTWIEAARASYLFSFDDHRVHVNAIESNGAIGKQVDEVDTQDYDGADCSHSADGSATYRGVLDHTGKSLYVQIFGYATNYDGSISAVCSAYQFFQVSDSGKLTFNGAYVWPSSCCGEVSQNLTFTGNDRFAYGMDTGLAGAAPSISFFARESNGALGNINDSAETPPAPPLKDTDEGPIVGWDWQPAAIDADPFGHVAVLGNFQGESSIGTVISDSGDKLASFTVKSNGDLVTSNTYAELATPGIAPYAMNMSPSGKFLAIGGQSEGSSGKELQVFHFNGAAAITPFGGPFGDAASTVPYILTVRWDNNNHLYAAGEDRLYVYTVTESGITGAPGSPYKFDGALSGAGLIVIPTP